MESKVFPPKIANWLEGKLEVTVHDLFKKQKTGDQGPFKVEITVNDFDGDPADKFQKAFGFKRRGMQFAMIAKAAPFETDGKESPDPPSDRSHERWRRIPYEVTLSIVLQAGENKVDLGNEGIDFVKKIVAFAKEIKS